MAEQISQAGRKQFIEWLGELDPAHLVVLDLDPLNKRLVELSPQVRRSLLVGPVEIFGEVESQRERLFHVGGLLLRNLDLHFGRVQLTPDPRLLGAKQIQRHGFRIVGLEQLFSLPPERDHLALGAFEVGRSLLAAPPNGQAKLLRQYRAFLGLDPDTAVGGLDLPLDDLGQDVALSAIAPFLMTPDAEEVEVLPLGLGQAEPGAASFAVDGALQVVVVGAVLLTRNAVRTQHLPHPLEHLRRDQRLMATGVLDPLERDHARVVGIG